MSGLGWKIAGGALAIGSVGWAGFNVVTLVAHEERTEVTTYEALTSTCSTSTTRTDP